MHRWQSTYKIWSQLKPAARKMRRQQTEAEDLLWKMLRGKKLDGVKFRRQHAIGNYVVDFYCSEFKVIIEVDGKIHDNQSEEDKLRENDLKTLGYAIRRFTNEEILENVNQVVEQIQNFISKTRKLSHLSKPHPALPARGEGSRGPFS